MALYLLPPEAIAVEEMWVGGVALEVKDRQRGRRDESHHEIFHF